jgi:hypothetical protein
MRFVFAALLALSLTFASGDRALAYNPYDVFCPAGYINACGQRFLMPRGKVGERFTYRLPDNFVTPYLVLVCGMGGEYEPASPTTACDVKTCPEENVSICHVDIRVAGGAQEGGQVKIDVPPVLLGAGQASPYGQQPSPSFYVKCANKGGALHYEILGMGSVSCADFPCEPAHLTVCGADVFVPSYERLGAVVETTTSRGEKVMVQCLGSGSNRPTLQITDSTKVKCP